MLDRALQNDPVLSKCDVRVEQTAALFRFSGGDARKLLNILELLEQGGCPYKRYGAFLDGSEKAVLLAFAETMDFVDKQYRAPFGKHS